MALYKIYNGAMPTTAAPSSVTTGTSLKTMLQVKPGSTQTMRVKEWGISFDGSAAATPIKCELIEVDVAATVTAAVANDIVKYDGDAIAAGDPTTNIFSVGTSATGYTSTSEGSVTASRLLDLQLISPTNQYVYQFVLGDEPMIQAGKFLRIRVTAGAAVNAYCYVKVVA